MSTLLESSSLIRRENDAFNVSSSQEGPICNVKKRHRFVLVGTLAGLAVMWASLSSSRQQKSFENLHHGHSRAEIDNFIHSFESENSKQMLLEAPTFEYHQGHLDHLVYFNSTSSYAMLKTDGDQSSAIDFFTYVSGGWEAQINQAFCPIASSAALLNSLKGQIELPQDPTYIPFTWATQQQLIQNECVKEKVFDVDKSGFLFFGLGMGMATKVLNCHLSGQGYVAEAHHVDPDKVSIDDVREMIQGAVLDENSRIMINYDRGGFGQGPRGHGHFSPIGAYNAQIDAFLVMDVAKYKFPPVWVPTLNLYHGIASRDFCSSFNYPDHAIDLKSVSRDDLLGMLDCRSQYRGFVVVSPEE